ncbi:uncharacterized protein [Miscanthus floridulus]|uniref:uncharacterized protein isoform X2 n=1 Tax=Miscanthus floridulus TaxID=154761 RepID=UPI003458F85D
MEVRRQLLPVFEVFEDDQRDGCAMDGAASPTDEAGAIHGGREGMETRDTLHESAMDNIGYAGCEENLFFDLGTGDDSSSEDGDDSRKLAMLVITRKCWGQVQKMDEFWSIANKDFCK